MRNPFQHIVPKSFLWRLTILNIIVIASAIILSGWGIYNTACFLVGGMGHSPDSFQQSYNATLFRYVLLFAVLAVIVSSLVQFYFTKKLIGPIKKLIDSTKILKQGTYPDPLPISSNDEIGELINHYNELIQKLHDNEEYRKKLVEDISHELRTPLANLTGYLHAFKSGDIDVNKQLLHALHGQAIQLTTLIDQMERLNEWDGFIEKKEMKENVQIKTLIEECIQSFTWEMEKEHIHAQMNIEQSELTVHPEGITQVLNNLLDNAIRYCEGDKTIYINGEKNENTYTISVSNSGAHIDQSTQEQLFKRFYRIDQSRNRKTGGAGLGLAIAKEIIENHHGKIEVQSKDGINTFAFTLPLEIMQN